MKKYSRKLVKHALKEFGMVILRLTRFLVRNIVDMCVVIWPLPSSDSHPTGRRYLILNWRDMKHAFAGGAEVYVHELAKRWVQKGHKVTVFCGNDGNAPRYEVIDGVEIIRRGGFYFVYVWAFLYYMVKFRGRYDVIIDCENGIPFFTPMYAREKIYLLIHHVHQEVFRKSLRPPLSWLALYLELYAMPYVYRSVQIVTVSESSKRDIEEYGLSEKSPLVIHNGVDLKAYAPGKKSEHPLVLYVGRLKYYKSINVLLKAADILKKTIPNLKVVIAGDGEERENLIKYARKLKLGETVSFLGRVSEAEKISLYQKAWVFVYPSFMEGWGSTNIEANACATPVVASNVPGLRDSVQDGITGFLVPYGNAPRFAEKISAIITNNALRNEMEKNALQWAKNFDWDKNADEALAVFSP